MTIVTTSKVSKGTGIENIYKLVCDLDVPKSHDDIVLWATKLLIFQPRYYKYLLFLKSSLGRYCWTKYFQTFYGF